MDGGFKERNRFDSGKDCPKIALDDPFPRARDKRMVPGPGGRCAGRERGGGVGRSWVRSLIPKKMLASGEVFVQLRGVRRGGGIPAARPLSPVFPTAMSSRTVVKTSQLGQPRNVPRKFLRPIMFP